MVYRKPIPDRKVPLLDPDSGWATFLYNYEENSRLWDLSVAIACTSWTSKNLVLRGFKATRDTTDLTVIKTVKDATEINPKSSWTSALQKGQHGTTDVTVFSVIKAIVDITGIKAIKNTKDLCYHGASGDTTDMSHQGPSWTPRMSQTSSHQGHHRYHSHRVT